MASSLSLCSRMASSSALGPWWATSWHRQWQDFVKCCRICATICTKSTEIGATMYIPADPHHVSLLVTLPSESMMDFASSCLSGSLLRGSRPAGMQHNRQLVHFIVRAVRFTAWLPCSAASWYACPCGASVSVCVSLHSLAWHNAWSTASWMATIFTAT